MWNLTFLFFSCLSVLSCRPDDYPKRQFTSCETLATEIGYSTNKLTVSVNLNSLTGTLASIEWDFGDGTAKQTSLNSTQTHTYSKAGTYTITVTLTDKCTKTLVKTATVTVTDKERPVFTTVIASNVTSSSAITGVKFTNSGNPSVVQFGICYSYTNSTPTTDNATVKIFSSNSSLNADITQQLDNLQPNVTYYYRAFAVTTEGTYYAEGEVLIFKTKPDLTSGLVAYIPFNGNGFDATSNKNNAVLTDAVGRSIYDSGHDGTAGGSFRFNGSTYLKIEDSPSLRLRTLSVSFWFKPETLPSATNQYQHFLYKANYDQDYYQEYSTSMDWNSSTGVRFKADVKQNSNCQAGNWQSLVQPYTIKLDWQHVVVLYMSNKIVAYINGQKIGEYALSANTGIDSCIGGDLIIGAQSNRSSNFFRGLMDEIRIYNTILTEDQINALSQR